MAGTLYLSTRNLLVSQGSLGGIPGPSASFELTVQGDVNLVALEAVMGEFWKQYELLCPKEVWFARAVREQGTPDIASWVTALVVGLQWVAGDAVGAGRVLEVSKNRYTLVVPWERQEVLEGALLQATRLIVLWQRTPAPSGEECAFALDEFDAWLSTVGPGRFHAHAKRMMLAAKARTIPVAMLPDESLAFGWGAARGVLNDVKRHGALSPVLGWRNCLAAAGFPVLPHQSAEGETEAQRQAAKLGFPLHVTHPSVMATDWHAPLILDKAGLTQRLASMKKKGHERVLLQPNPAGIQYQVVLLDHRVVIATRLLVSTNKAGGTRRVRIDASSTLHPSNRALFERASKVIGQRLIQLTVHAADISRAFDAYASNPVLFSDCLPLRAFDETAFKFPHRDLAWDLVSQLLPAKTGRVPLTAIGGSFGTATTARMLMSIWQAAGRSPGLSTAKALWVGTRQISQQELTPLESVQALFAQADVDAVVFEIPESGLGVQGHPVDAYEVSAFVNFQPGLAAKRGRDVVARLAQEAGLHLEQASGALVVNAEDEVCLASLARGYCQRRILVAPTNPKLPVLKRHLDQGGEAIVLTEREGRQWAVLLHGRSTIPVMPVDEIPASGGGLIASLVVQALFAIALGVAHDVEVAVIRRGLSAFSTEQY